MPKNTTEPRISVRVSADLKARIENVCQRRNLSEPDLVRACVIALCDYFDKYGSVPREIAIRPSDAEIAAMRRQLADHDEMIAAEDPAKYPRKKKTG